MLCQLPFNFQFKFSTALAPRLLKEDYQLAAATLQTCAKNWNNTKHCDIIRGRT
jgi:hypothetical protein